MLLAGCESTSSVVRVCVCVCVLVSHCGSNVIHKLSVRVPISRTHNTHYCISIALIEKSKKKKCQVFFSRRFSVYIMRNMIGLGHNWGVLLRTRVFGLPNSYATNIFCRVNSEEPEDNNVAVIVLMF